MRLAVVLVLATGAATNAPRAQGTSGVPRLERPQPPRDVRDTTQEFADGRVAAWVDPLPTTTRVFPMGDMLTMTAPHAGAVTARATLASLDGHVVRSTLMIPVSIPGAVRFVLPLDGIAKGPYQLIVETSRGRIRTPIGVVEVPDR